MSSNPRRVVAAKRLSKRHQIFLAALGLMPFHSALAVTEADFSQAFPLGSTGYQPNIPPPASNLLSSATLSFTQAPRGGENTSIDYNSLIDGSYGTTPPSGGGGPNAVAINDNTTLTYSLPSAFGYNLSSVDIFTGWGDGGRIIPRVTVRYSTVANPAAFLTLQDVNYAAAGGNGAYVNLTNLGLDTTAVSKLQFVFPTQQNGYVGYVELAAQGTVAPPPTDDGKIWSGAVNGNWDTTTANWSGGLYAEGDAVKFQNLNAANQPVTNRNITVRAGGVHPSKVTFANTPGNDYIFSNAGADPNGIAGTATVTINGGGLVAFGSPNTYTGGTSVINGTLLLGAAGTVGSGPLYVGAFGTVDLGGSTQTVSQLGTSPILGNGGTLANGTINVLGNPAYMQAGNFTANLTSTPASTARLFIGGDPTAILSLGGLNTLTNADGISSKIGDPTTGAAGTVKLLTTTALGPISHSTQITSGTLDLNGQTNVTVKSFILPSNQAAIVNNAGPVTYAGEMITTAGLGPDGAPVIGGGSGDVTLSGIISGTGGIRKTGAGTLNITGVNNAYSGNTIFEGGVVNVAQLADYGLNSSLGNRAPGADGGVNVSMLFRGGTLQYTGSAPQFTNRAIRISTQGGGAIDASGSNPNATLNFTLADSPDWWENGGDRTFSLTGTNTGLNTLAGMIRDLPGVTTINMRKAGPGNWYLTNSASTYKGATLFDGGILNVAALSDYGVPGSLGQRDLVTDQTAANGARAYVGLLFHGGTLQYTGAVPTSTNRLIRVGLEGAVIDASGANPAATMSFTANAKSPDLFENGGTRTITLTGTNTGANTFATVLDEFGGGVTTTNLAKDGTGTWVIPVANEHLGTTTVNNGILRVTGSIAFSSGLTVNGGTYEAAAAQTIQTATVNSGGTLKVTGGTPLAPTVLKLGNNVVVPFVANGTGKIDVAAGAVAVDLAPADLTAGLVATRAGIIAGVNVTSSTAALNPSAAGIGYATAVNLFGPGNGGTFLGTPVDNSTVLVRYTLLGDATLDGLVDFNDLVQLAQNYNTLVQATTDSWWYNGDFTNDGLVDFNDLVKLAQNYNSALPLPPSPSPAFAGDWAAAIAAVPEPASAGAIVVLATATLLRRRRRPAYHF